MLRKIFFLNIFFFITLSFNSYSFEKQAEQLIQSTTDNAKKINGQILKIDRKLIKKMISEI